MAPFITHVLPLLDYYVAVWSTGYVGVSLEALDQVHSGPRKFRLSWEIKISKFILSTWSFAPSWHNWLIFHNKCANSPSDLFVLIPDLAIGGHQYKAAHVRNQCEVRRRSFNVGWIPLWNFLPESIVTLRSLSLFKSTLAFHLLNKLLEYY